MQPFGCNLSEKQASENTPHSMRGGSTSPKAMHIAEGARINSGGSGFLPTRPEVAFHRSRKKAAREQCRGRALILQERLLTALL
jgi:hypothetical protein